MKNEERIGIGPPGTRQMMIHLLMEVDGWGSKVRLGVFCCNITQTEKGMLMFNTC
jgi:hypothetical protein